ncbi:hypothetical protein OPIT5_27470 [Opitutaceae bacterium TAV5]|nr:hypothetical protein OPIT5_27470 [Opitutaceae bacterium TAV5]
MNATALSPLPLRADWPLSSIYRLADTRQRTQDPSASPAIVFRVLPENPAVFSATSGTLVLTACRPHVSGLYDLLAGPWRFLARIAHIHRVDDSVTIGQLVGQMAEHNETLRILSRDTSSGEIIFLRPPATDPQFGHVLAGNPRPGIRRAVTG